MTDGGQTSGTDAASWLPPELEGNGQTSATGNEGLDNGDHAGKTDGRLAVPANARKDQEPRPATGNGRPAEPVEGQDRDVTPSERRLASRLRQANLRLRAQDEEIEGLQAKVEELKAEIEDSKRAHAAQAAGARKAAKPKPARPTMTAKPKRAVKPKRAAKPKRGSGLDVNSATFEQLRELGLSITQSSRLIAYRDTRGGFESLDDVAAVPGFSRDTLRDLSSRVQF
jgi:DNA uptake protein ComE-like DNA-binding protein